MLPRYGGDKKPQRKARRIAEDEPGWNPKTMGNRSTKPRLPTYNPRPYDPNNDGQYKPPPRTFLPSNQDAVKKFQRFHGLVPDGIIGPKTTAKMRETHTQLVRPEDIQRLRRRKRSRLLPYGPYPRA